MLDALFKEGKLLIFEDTGLKGFYFFPSMSLSSFTAINYLFQYMPADYKCGLRWVEDRCILSIYNKDWNLIKQESVSFPRIGLNENSVIKAKNLLYSVLIDDNDSRSSP